MIITFITTVPCVTTTRSSGGLTRAASTGNSSYDILRKVSVINVKFELRNPARFWDNSNVLIQSASPITKIRCSLFFTGRVRYSIIELDFSTSPTAGFNTDFSFIKSVVSFSIQEPLLALASTSVILNPFVVSITSTAHAEGVIIE